MSQISQARPGGNATDSGHYRITRELAGFVWAIAYQVIVCVKFCKGFGLGGLAELGFFVLFEVVHVEVAVCFEPVLVGFDGKRSDEAAA